MIKFTAPDGSSVSIDPKLVIRARRSLGHEGAPGGSRIDWPQMQLVMEAIDEVAAKIKAKKRAFTFLTSRDGSKIWFDAKKVRGPLPLPANMNDNRVKSSLALMGYRQYVTETPKKVRKVITDAGGTPVS